jgi:hypothetical protein
MRIRPLLVVTALLSSLLGAVAVYLALTVPNDLQASALLKQARTDMSAGNNERARLSLTRVIQQYPRTDAAAAATVALSSIEAQERQRLVVRIDALQRVNDQQSSDLQSLGAKIAAPPPAPVVAAAPAPAPPPKAAPHPSRTTHRTKRRSHHR